jgi:HD-GYP domain-containing protein (c-di-GMP phosphodiesterase class II)
MYNAFMNIKNRIKLSFLIIIILVLTVGSLSIAILYQIRQNNFVKDKISHIILIQERMNEAIEEQIYVENISDINSIKTDFYSYEKSFETIKIQIQHNQTFSLFSRFFKDEAKKLDILHNLERLFENEHKIELAFEEMNKLQENFINFNAKFAHLYPEENSLRKTLEKDIDTFHPEYIVMKIFGQVQYYSKETLYQDQNRISLSKWIDYTTQLHEKLNNKITDQYLYIVKQIGEVAIEIKNTNVAKEQLLDNIRIVLEENKKIGMNISQNIEDLSSSSSNRALIISFILIVFLISFLVFITYFVTKKVGLSVDEIEKQIQEGIEEIQHLNQEISDTQKEVIFTMGAIGEQRSKETGNHVKRVAEYSQILALHYGLSENEAQMLKQASPMHDIGKIAIPDTILNKPGKFEPHEREIMETHANLGFEMLKSSNRPLLKMAAIVANEHHEKWDGSGYPRGLSGENIHIYGRITALADVFDALGSDRVYKKAWDNEKIFTFFKEQKGKHFDPQLIDIFFENLDEFLNIQAKFKDISSV